MFQRYVAFHTGVAKVDRDVVYVAIVVFVCWIRYVAFHTDVAKIDWDVAHVAMVVHVCCKLLFSMFHQFFF
jgi:hypothetical protein